MVHDELPKYLLATLKQRTEKAARTAGNASRAADSPAGSALRFGTSASCVNGGHTENSHGTA